MYFFLFRKNRKEGTEKMSQSTYTYDVYEEFLKVTIDSPDKNRNLTVKYSDVKKSVLYG